jgi:hypothetical protein
MLLLDYSIVCFQHTCEPHLYRLRENVHFIIKALELTFEQLNQPILILILKYHNMLVPSLIEINWLNFWRKDLGPAIESSHLIDVLYVH